jgi:hypothetical protein
MEVKMNELRGTMLGLVIVMGGVACSAQQVTIPFEKIEKDAQLSATLTLPANDTASGLYSSSVSSATTPSESSGFASGSGFTRGTPTPVRRRGLGSNFFLLNGLSFGMAIMDVEMTQHCLSTHKCREGNPLMPSSQAGALSVNLALTGAGTWISYLLKKHESHSWWIAPTSGIGSHTVGVATGLMHR